MSSLFVSILVTGKTCLPKQFCRTPIMTPAFQNYSKRFNNSTFLARISKRMYQHCFPVYVKRNLEAGKVFVHLMKPQTDRTGKDNVIMRAKKYACLKQWYLYIYLYNTTIFYSVNSENNCHRTFRDCRRRCYKILRANNTNTLGSDIVTATGIDRKWTA